LIFKILMILCPCLNHFGQKRSKLPYARCENKKSSFGNLIGDFFFAVTAGDGISLIEIETKKKRKSLVVIF